MSTSRQIENVNLDDEDLEKRNEALIIENEVLSEQVFESQMQMVELAKRVNQIRGVQEIGIVEPGEVRKLYADIQAAIEAFVRPMDQFIRENTGGLHRKRISRGLWDKARFKHFRDRLRIDVGLRMAAMHPMTNNIDIWTAHIWRLLVEAVFKEGEFEKFWLDNDKEGKGSDKKSNGSDAKDNNVITNENVSSYMTSINELDKLMRLADPPIFGHYARRLWKRQALAAVFRTGNFKWVQDRRAARIKEIAEEILESYRRIFAQPMPRRRQLELMQNIVAAAVRLNEHIHIEADDNWTLEIYGELGQNPDPFYHNIKEFDLKPVGTTIALRDNAPLISMSDRLSPEVNRNRLQVLCVMAPALRYSHIGDDGRDYQDAANLVKPQVLVAVEELPRAQDEPEPAKAVPNNQIFYQLAHDTAL